MTRRSPSPYPRFGVPSNGPEPVTTAQHPHDVDVSVTEWATDLMTAEAEAAVASGTRERSTGFVDFDVVDSVHATSQAATVAVVR